jgi:hypothetical protein
MTLMDQGASKPAIDEVETVAVYKRGARGIVCQIIVRGDGYVLPAGWAETPTELGWTGDEAIFLYVPDVDDTEPPAKPARKKAAD